MSIGVFFTGLYNNLKVMQVGFYYQVDLFPVREVGRGWLIPD